MRSSTEASEQRNHAGVLRVKAKAQVFLSYARPDEEEVAKLYQELSDAGFKPWMDTKDILPGENWRLSIHRAIFVPRQVLDTLEEMKHLLRKENSRV